MTIKFEVTRTKYYEKWLIYRRQIRQIFSCIFVLVVEQACIFADMLFQRVSDFPPMLSYVKWRYSFIITPSVANKTKPNNKKQTNKQKKPTPQNNVALGM